MSNSFGKGDLFVSTEGNDQWSGRLAEPNVDGTDGPLATIARARDVIRERKRFGHLSGSLTVWIRGGRYAITEPIVLGPEDSAPVTYAAYPGEQPIIDGSTRIEGWRVGEKDGREVWIADLPEVAEGKWYFRQLFVSGERRTRSRLPKEGFYSMADLPPTDESTDTFRCVPGDVQAWRNLTDVDVVVLHWWIEERLPIATFDEETCTVVSSRRSMMPLRDDIRDKPAKYYVEHVYEGLSEPGEWYLDRTEGRLYYVPMPGEMLDEIDAYAPRTQQFLRFEGEPDEGRYVEFLRFEGLVFEHGGWYQPSGNFERWGKSREYEYAGAPQAAVHVPGAIYFEGARNCAIEDCRIAHIGWYGVELGNGCTGCRVVGNELYDMGAGGVKLDGADAQGPLCRRTGNNVVTDNHVHDGGLVFPSCVGIVSLYSFGNEISHNHIHDLFYSGISCGWEWAYAEGISKDNIIEKNYIHHLGKGRLSDMGGIYTLGVQPGTVIRGNVIHDIEKWAYGGWAIYPDEGSSHILIENNVCYNTSSQPFHQHYGRENIVRNNVFAFGREGQAAHGKIYGREGLYRPELEGGRKGFYFERNIVVTDGQPLFVAGYGAPLEERNFLSDLNLFWDVSGQELVSGRWTRDENDVQVLDPKIDMEEWRSLGQDTHSIVADPRFKDLGGRDFTLLEDSPAFALGFQPIDTSDVGPRPKGQRSN